MIVGQPGSGKSTLARLLGARTGLPVYHMDHIHWLSDWIERPRSDKLALAREIQARDVWIFEGGMSALYDERATRADLAIWLDLPVTRRLLRVGRRVWHWYGRSRPDLPDGCRERVDVAFLWYIVRTGRTGRRVMERMAERHPGKLVRLTSQRQIDRWLAGVPPRRASGRPPD